MLWWTRGGTQNVERIGRNGFEVMRYFPLIYPNIAHWWRHLFQSKSQWPLELILKNQPQPDKCSRGLSKERTVCTRKKHESTWELLLPLLKVTYAAEWEREGTLGEVVSHALEKQTWRMIKVFILMRAKSYMEDCKWQRDIPIYC